MSRYRPKTVPGSPYITAAGYKRLNDELARLWSKRREVTKKLAAAAAEGDRSENADYIYRKKQLREMDRRIRYLSKRLDGINVVDRVPADQQRVFFGAWVTVEDENGQRQEYRIVGPDEFDPACNWISMDSPLAKAVLGKACSDVVELKLPDDRQDIEIVAVRYS